MSHITTATEIAEKHGFTQTLRVRDLVEMYAAAERQADLDDLVVLVPSSPKMLRAMADRDHRASEFSRFFDGCAKPSDLQKVRGGFGSDTGLFDDADEEPVRYGFVNPYGVACDLAARWTQEGYSSLWLRSDKRVLKSRGMVGNGDDFRRGEKRAASRGAALSPLIANRIALTNKRGAAGAIANAIRQGQRFPELCEAGKLDIRVHEEDDADQARHRIETRRAAMSAPSPLPIVAIPVMDNPFACPVCGDAASFCDCADMATIGKRAA